MKIGSINTKAAVSSTPTERKTSATSSTTKGAEPSAKVQLSATAKLSAGATEGSFDAEKVKRIADAIRDGKYEINADAIADKLIANAQDVLSTGRKA